MTIDAKAAEALFTPNNGITGDAVKAAIDKKGRDEEDGTYERDALAALSLPYVGPAVAAVNETWIIPAFDAAMRLPRETGTVYLVDFTSSYRMCVGMATTWASLMEQTARLVSMGFRRCPTVHTIIVFMDSPYRNMQRLLTQIDRLKDVTDEEKRQLRQAFDFANEDTRDIQTEIESRMPKLSDEQTAMMTFFADYSRPLSELVVAAEKVAPYIQSSCTNWFSDTRVRLGVFVTFLARVLSDPHCLHWIFGWYRWESGAWPAIVCDALMGTQGHADELRVTVAAYPDDGPERPYAYPEDLLPASGSVASDALFRFSADGPQLYRRCVEADFNQVTWCFWLQRLYGMCVIVDNFDGDIPLAIWLMMEQFRLFPENVVHYGPPAFAASRVRDRSVVDWAVPRRPTEPGEVAPILWVRNTTRWFTIIHMQEAYCNMYGRFRKMLAWRETTGMRARPRELYPGEQRASEEMPALALFAAACVPNDYVLVTLTNAPKQLLDRTLEIMQAGVGYMRAPGEGENAPYLPYVRMSYVQSAAYQCQNAIAYGQTLHSASYFLEMCCHMRRATTMSATWQVAEKGEPVTDVYQYAHWAGAATAKKGKSDFIVDCDGGHFRKLRSLDALFGQQAVRFRVFSSRADYEAAMVECGGAAEGEHPLDGVDYALASLDKRPLCAYKPAQGPLPEVVRPPKRARKGDEEEQGKRARRDEEEEAPVALAPVVETLSVVDPPPVVEPPPNLVAEMRRTSVVEQLRVLLGWSAVEPADAAPPPPMGPPPPYSASPPRVVSALDRVNALLS
jgi:hypothetical protein